jgi:hypothetical protein
MWKKINTYMLLVGKREGTGLFGKPGGGGVDGRVILKWILQK